MTQNTTDRRYKLGNFVGHLISLIFALLAVDMAASSLWAGLVIYLLALLLFAEYSVYIFDDE